MKKIIIFIFLVLVVLPAFSQTNHVQRFRTLGDSINTTYTRSNARLANYDSMILDDGSIKKYTSYKRDYELLVKALQESEAHLNLLLRTNDRVAYIKEERDNYEVLIKQLESMKNEYDNWLRTVQ